MIFGKRFLFAALAVAAALGCLFGFAACGDDGEEQQPPEVYLVRELTFDNVRLIPKYYGDNFQGYSIDLYHEGQPLPRMDCQWEMLKSDGTRGSSAWFSDEGMPLYLNYMSGIFECVAFEKEADGHTREDVYWKGTAVLYYKDVGLTLDLRIYEKEVYLFGRAEDKTAFYRDTGIEPEEPENPDVPDLPDNPDLPPEFQFTETALSFGTQQSGTVSKFKGLKYTFSLSDPALAEFRVACESTVEVCIYDANDGESPFCAPEESVFSCLLPEGNYFLTVKAKENAEAIVDLMSFSSAPLAFEEGAAQLSFDSDVSARAVKFVPQTAGNYRFSTNYTGYALTVYDGRCAAVLTQGASADHVVSFAETSEYVLVFTRGNAGYEQTTAVTAAKASDLSNANPETPENISPGRFTASIDADKTTLYYSFSLSSATIVQLKIYPDRNGAEKRPSLAVTATDMSASLSVMWRTSDCGYAADYLPAGDYTVRLTGDVGEYDVAIEDAVSLSRFVSFDQKFRLSPRGTEYYWYSFTYYAGTSGNGSDNNTVHLYLDGSASGAAGLYNGTRAAFTVKMYNLEDDWLKEAGSAKVTHSDPFSLFSKGTNPRYRAGYFTNGRTPLVSGRIYYACFAFDGYASGETQFWLTNTMIR